MKARRWAALLLLLVLWTCAAQAEEKAYYEEAWYPQALEKSVMSVGNNARLKKVIDKARRGETITLAVIGGSITEGAGARTYRECWAFQLKDQFKKAYGAKNTNNVSLVNAGVAGTDSVFGYMRYQREVVDRVTSRDADGLPDLVVIEYSVNDGDDPTNHRCYESMVKEILDAPNEPAVILLFAVFKGGWNLQEPLRKIGDRYDLMMVSIRDGIFPLIGTKISPEEFFYDDYHPTSLGHRIMADCVMQAIEDAAEAKTDPAPAANPKPVYGTDFLSLKTIFGNTATDEFTIDRGGFPGSDGNSYRNKPVGQVCGKNFFHDVNDPMDPLKVTGVFRKCLIAWKASADASFGSAEILVDGKVIRTVRGKSGKWGQSEVVLVLDEKEPAKHTLEIRVKEEGKKFTVTAISLQ